MLQGRAATADTHAAGYDVRLAGVAPLVTLGAAVVGGQEVATVAEPSPAAPLPAHLHVQLVAVAGLAQSWDQDLAWLGGANGLALEGLGVG